VENHLSENEIAQYMEALAANKQAQLPEKIMEHVEESFERKVEIICVRLWVPHLMPSLEP